MDVYPEEYITHEAPLLVVSGLGSSERHCAVPSYPLLEKGPYVSSNLPCISSETAEHLLDFFHKNDATGIWGGKLDRVVKGSGAIFRIRTVGRQYRLPPRKANPPFNPASYSAEDGHPARVLHSPISPLSPESPLYADGVFFHMWLRKHQSIIPSVFVTFYELFNGTEDVNQQNLHDNEIIASINQQRKHFLLGSSSLSQNSSVCSDELRSSGHRTKFVAIIISNRSILSSVNMEDRLSYIKRNTNLTTNTTFFFLPASSSPVELEQFVSSLLATLYPGSIEYYREMTKHARRKRNKGSVPSPTVPASRALSSQAWVLRYEIKLGIFSEFRQEMDNAGKNYETAYEKLFTEVFESTSSWAGRWSEARLLSDFLTLRVIRCYLWSQNYVAAKQRWSYHIKRTRDILDRKGKGTDTYGFAAWLGRWNKCLAELLQSGALPIFKIQVPKTTLQSSLVPIVINEPAIYAEPPPSKAANKHLSSLDILHHPGFYYFTASELTTLRKKRALKIYLDDGPSTDLYDTYLCPVPQDEHKTDYTALQISLLLSARAEFESRNQRRMAASITYKLAQLKNLKAVEKPELWGDALKDLRAIAPLYRREGWWDFLEDILWRTVECGKKEGDASIVIAAAFELMCGTVFKQRKNWTYDLNNCLDGIEVVNKPAVVLTMSDIVSSVSTSYTFEFSSVHAGQSVTSQLTIFSSAHESSKPLVFAAMTITYEGNLKTITIAHASSESNGSQGSKMKFVDLKGRLNECDDSKAGIADSKGSLVGTADLSLSPGETKIYELSSILREPGSAKIIGVELRILSDNFELDLGFTFENVDSASLVHPIPFKIERSRIGGNAIWWSLGEDESWTKKSVRAEHPERLTILPRPPKIDVIPKGLDKGLFVDETANIELEAVNNEDEDADFVLSVKIIGWINENQPVITWKKDGQLISPAASSYNLGTVNSSSKSVLSFSFVSCSVPLDDCSLEIKVLYHLLSDPETHIEKKIIVDMPISNPFQSSFDFSPRVHPEPWPNYFSISDELFDSVCGEPELKPRTNGITQRWCLTTKILGGPDSIYLENWDLPIQTIEGGATCAVSPSDMVSKLLEPQKFVDIQFIFDVQKHLFEDRSPSIIDTDIILRWRRSPDSPENTSKLLVPRLFVPLREPRVLAAAAPLSNIPGILRMSYTVENPTNYFLTFSVLFETNSQFAFSGPKQTSLQLLPMSRHTLEYRLYPYVRDAWIKPSLKVVDRYFNKALKCSPGSDGMALDKTELLVWVPGDLGD